MKLLGSFALVSAALVVMASAQPFQLLVTQGAATSTVQNGAILTFAAPVGQTATTQVKVTYLGTGQVLIGQPPSILGSTAFTASLSSAPPVTLSPGASTTLTIQFTPATASLSAAQLSLPYTETVPAAVSGGAATITSGSISLALQGGTPSFTVSYILQSTQNALPLANGGTILFPPTPVNASAQAAFDLTNTGSGPGVVTGITITGAAFSLSGLPLFPQTVAAGATLQVQLIYKPTAVASDTGQIQVTFGTGSPVTVNLQGSGSSAGFTYQILQSGSTTTIGPGGTIPIPGTNVGQTSSVVVRVVNSGNASGTVSSINVNGQGYSLSNVPVLPQTLAPNASLTFLLNFLPTQAGTINGSLFVNSDTLFLSGVGLGPQFGFSYVSAGNTVTLSATNTSVVFSPVTISQTAQVVFDVKNTGTVPATISNIGIGQANSPYTLTGLPALPVTLAPGADFHFTITYKPTGLGFSNGTLILDTTTITLIGSGTAPPALPAYTITGATGTVAPGTQPVIGLTLASPYPVDLSGVLTATTNGTLPADPAVVFATGASTVSFVIPANTTSAVFGSQGTQIGLQTGTVAGTITLAPTFATQAGNVDITPASPTTLQLTVGSVAPTLLAIELSGQTTNSFTISVTGFTTSRSLSTLNVQFTTAPGYSMPVTKFTVDVSQISTVWFQSAASHAYGGQFTLSVPFTFSGSVPTGQTVLSSIASVAASVTSAQGTSNSLQVSAQ